MNPGRSGPRPSQLLLKRVLDVAVSFTFLFLFAPVLALIGFLIKRESEGPVFYRGVRVGLKGRPFRVYKFRSMVQNAAKLGGPSTADDDPRITRMGRVIRKFKLDELAQLLNVFRGDMSLVGPRPEVQMYVDLYTPEERVILDVPPGITDWASAKYHNEGEILKGAADPERAYMERIYPGKQRLRLAYARDPSLKNDLAILWTTITTLVSTRLKR